MSDNHHLLLPSPGRDLDKLVAARVLGWIWVRNTKGCYGWAVKTVGVASLGNLEYAASLDEWHDWVSGVTPAFSSNITDAWTVMEWIRLSSDKIRNNFSWPPNSPWWVGPPNEVAANICRLALRAVGACT